jgi:membrane-associated phospholipid phosphatase
LVLKNLKLRATLTGLLIAAFTWTGAFAQNSPVLNQPQPSTNYVRSYSIASAKEAFNADGLAEPTLQPSPELTLATSTLATSDDDALPQSTGASSANSPDSHKRGLVSRSVRRTLQDQKELYAAPFHRQNLKWDAMFLVGTAALIATDRQSARAISNTNINAFRNMSNVSIAGLGVALGGTLMVGLIKDHPHAKETGLLGLESLVNTFMVYAPMQVIAGRERPTEGTGNGRFLQNHAFNTSFPGGHGMFAMSMATIIAHEYRKPWVEVLAYGAAAAVTAGRIGAKMHFNSDILVGSSLGFLISRHIFYAHCDPDLSDGCHR